MDNVSVPVKFSQRVISWLVISLLVWQPVAPAVAAAITPNGPATMDKAANGVPVVNIATPGQAGISHNQFKDYNVGKEGLILNNATGQLTQTQLGGLIQNNPNLRAGQEARGIINEVTGGSRSQLQGYTEVAGKAANVMVANPYGITCNGCGFINTPQATLTTGKPQLDANGALSALEVSRGTITVEGKGIDASGSDALSLISRATEVNAAIHAKALNVIAGANRVNADGSVKPVSGDGPAPTVAVDTGALGGMYANRIHLVSSDKGVGVNLGNLNARQGDISLSANGKLSVKDSLASGAITANADGVTLSGSHKAGGDITVASTRDVAVQNATLASDGSLKLGAAGNATLAGSSLTGGKDISLAAQQLAVDAGSSGDAAAGLNINAAGIGNKGKFLSGGETRLTADRLDNSGMVAARGQLTAKTVTLKNSGTLQGKTLTLENNSTDNTGTLAAKDNLDLHTGTLNTGADSVVTSDGTLTLTARERADLNGRVNAAGLLSISGKEVLSRNNAQLQSAGDIAITSGGNTTLDGTQAAKGALSVSAQNLTHGGKSSAAGIALTAAQSLNNSGTLVADALTLHSPHLTNSGLLQGTQGFDLQTGLLDNLTSGTLYSAQNLNFNIPQLNNSGLITTDGDLLVRGNTLINHGEINGVNLAGDYLNLSNLSTGRLLADGQLTLTGGDIANAGLIAASGLTLSGSTFNNTGNIQAAAALSLDAGELHNSGMLTGKAAVDIQARTLTNDGQILSEGNAMLGGQTLNNNGMVLGKTLTANHSAITNNGTLTGLESLTLDAQQTLNARLAMAVSPLILTNGANGQLLTQGELNLAAGTVNNLGKIQGNGVTVAAAALTNNAGGEITASQGLSLNAPTLLNYGLIQGAGETGIDAAVLARNEGKLISGARLTLTAPQYTGAGWLQATNLILNAANYAGQGTLLADEMTLTGDTFTNQSTTQANNLILNYRQLTNNGTLLGVNQLTVNATRVDQSANGKLFSGGDLFVGAAELNALGQIVALGNLTLRLTQAFTGKSTLAAGNTLAITSNGAIDNQSVMQGQAVNLSAGGQLTNSGKITTGSGASTLSGSAIVLNASGFLQGGGDIALTSRGNILTNGFTGTYGSLTLSAAGSIVNTALLYAANNLALYANSITNQRGDILAGNNLWMQRDAAGNANKDITNISGNIETEKGNITFRTEYLLNQWEKIIVGTITTEDLRAQLPKYAWDLPGTVNIPKEYFESKDLVYVNIAKPIGVTIDDVSPYSYVALVNPYLEKEIPISRVTSSTTAIGGMGNIRSGRDIIASATVFDNLGSSVLAENNISIVGEILNNKSWQSGVQTIYQVFKPASPYDIYARVTIDLDLGRTITSAPLFNVPDGFGIISYVATDEYRTESSTPIRGVLQAENSMDLNFFNVINDSDSVNVRGKITPSSLVGNTHYKDELYSDLSLLNNNLESVKTKLDNTEKNESTNREGFEKISERINELYNILSDSIINTDEKTIDISQYPLPKGQNGYFVPSIDPKSPYLINVNPSLAGLGTVDTAVFSDLYALINSSPDSAPRETRQVYVDENKYLGSSYILERLNISPEKNYRFLGDAAFDMRYVSNVLLSETGKRYLNGIGNDLEQMKYLMDNAIKLKESLNLDFGVSLDATQVAALDNSILWWESVSINNEKVMVPKIYLSPKDVFITNGSVVSGGEVNVTSETTLNNGSSFLATKGITINSKDGIDNVNYGLIQSQEYVRLKSIKDIGNLGSVIKSNDIYLNSVEGNIKNITSSKNEKNKYDWHSATETYLGEVGTIDADNQLIINAGGNLSLVGAKLISGGDIKLNIEGDIELLSNKEINKHQLLGNNEFYQSKIDIVGSSISANGNLEADAGKNFTLDSGSVSAGKSLTINALNDINFNAEGTYSSGSSFGLNRYDNNIARTIVSAGSNLTLTAGRDINSEAAGLVAEQNLGMQAGRDVNLLAEETTQGDSYKTRKKTVINEQVRQQGTEIASGGNTVIIAGRDMNAEAAQVTAGGNIGVQAGRDINLTTATESDYHYQEETKTKKGFLKKTKTHTISEQSATRESGTLLSGDNVNLKAGNDLLVKGSAVVGDGDVALGAGHDVSIVAATNTDSNWQFKEKTKSGLMSSGGIGFTIGSSKMKQELKEKGTTQSQSTSTVGSNGGSVSIAAGNQLHIGGSDLIAGKDLALTGDSVIIDPGHDKRTRDEKFEQKTSGLTVALSGSVGSMVNGAVTAAQAAKQESDSRLASLKATQAALSGIQAGLEKQLSSAEGSSDTAFQIAVSLGAQSSRSTTHEESDTVTGSRLTAGDNLTVTATGKGNVAGSGDITVAGSQLKAGKDVTLDAARDISLISGQNTNLLSGSNSSHGGSVGVALGFGGNTSGLSVSASANSSGGKQKGNTLTHSNTTVDAGNGVKLVSGRDTALAGAQVSGERVIADVGRDLVIASQQDIDNYTSKQSSVSGGLSYTFGGGGPGGSFSYSRDKMDSKYRNVNEQSGMFAGQGGFDVRVGEHTQLNGGVIASTAPAQNNRLDTGTLGFGDIYNEADFKVQHQGGGFSTGGIGALVASNIGNLMLAGAGRDGHSEGTTRTAISDGTVIIRDGENQKQDIGELSRDAQNANDSVGKIFDKEKEQRRLELAQLIGEIGSQVGKIVSTYGEIAVQKALKSPEAYIAAKELLAGKGNATPTDKEIEAQVKRTAMEGYGTGSALQRGIQAATAAVQGLAGGNINAALAGGAAPYLAEAIGHHMGLEDNPAAKVIAHAVAGAAIAAAQGLNAGAGAAGAGIGELSGMLALDIYGVKDAGALNEAQKQTISALATLASGLAGGLVGDSGASAVAGGQAGKTAVENNSLSDIIENQHSGMSQQERYQKAQDSLVKATEEFKAQNCAGLSSEACGAKMAAHRDELLAGAGLFGVDFVPVVGDIKSFAEAETAIDYLAATVGLAPGLGDVAGKFIKGAQKALAKGDVAEASRLINKASDEIQAVKPLDVGSYKELKDRSVVGDGLEHDHIPSFAAIRQAKENELGRKLTPAEEKNLYNNATAIEVPKDVHQAGPTYGGKNTLSQVKQDAIDLCGAECRDTDALRKNMLDRGYDPELVDDAIRQLKERNAQTGVTK